MSYKLNMESLSLKMLQIVEENYRSIIRNSNNQEVADSINKELHIVTRIIREIEWDIQISKLDLVNNLDQELVNNND